MKVRDIVAEPIRFHRLAENGAEVRRIVDLSARVLRRTAAAHFHRPRPGHPAALSDLRRTHLGAGRLHSGADSQPAEGPAGRTGPDHAFHFPRSAGDPADVRPGRGDAARKAPGNGGDGDALHTAAAFLYETPAGPHAAHAAQGVKGTGFTIWKPLCAMAAVWGRPPLSGHAGAPGTGAHFRQNVAQIGGDNETRFSDWKSCPEGSFP